METKIYNIDSIYRNTTKYPETHDFYYNIVDTVINGVQRVEPFNERNVAELEVSHINIPNSFHFINSTRNNNEFRITNASGTLYTLDDGSYTKDELVTELNALGSGITFSYSSTTGKISAIGGPVYFPSNNTDYPSLGEILGYSLDTIIDTTTLTEATNGLTLTQEKYLFLSIGDNIGNIINSNRGTYVAKILLNNSSRFDDVNNESFYQVLSNKVVFPQPRDIKFLHIQVLDYLGNSIDLNGVDFSFCLKIININNSILKQFEQMRFYSNDVMERILNARMLEHYEKQNSSHFTEAYSENTHKQFVESEYTNDGNKKMYGYDGNYDLYKPIIPGMN